MLSLQNPIALLSLNILGVGIDVAYAKETEQPSGATVHTITVCANFAVGCWSKHFRIGGNRGGTD